MAVDPRERNEVIERFFAEHPELREKCSSAGGEIPMPLDVIREFILWGARRGLCHADEAERLNDFVSRAIQKIQTQ